MSVPVLTDEAMDKLYAWHKREIGQHKCAADNESLACCIDSLMIAHLARKNLDVYEIATTCELTVDYVKRFTQIEGIEVRQ